MFNLISKIQNILVQKQENDLDLLKYKDLRITSRPTELEQKIPFKYFILPKPPANSSQKTKQELDELIKINAGRDIKTDTTIIQIDEDPSIIYRYFLKRQKLVFNKKLFDSLYDVLFNIVFDLKLHFNRPRPNQIAEFYGLKIDVLQTDTHQTPSYPSGHVAYAALAEMVITEEYPEFTDEVQALTDKVAFARVKQGVHFQSDNEASMKLVRTIYNDLKKYATETK